MAFFRQRANTRSLSTASTLLATLPDHPMAMVDELMHPGLGKPASEATSNSVNHGRPSPTATRQPVVRTPGAHTVCLPPPSGDRLCVCGRRFDGNCAVSATLRPHSPFSHWARRPSLPMGSNRAAAADRGGPDRRHERDPTHGRSWPASSARRARPFLDHERCQVPELKAA